MIEGRKINYSDCLAGSTLIYLLLPHLLFLAGWIQTLYSVPACCILLFIAYRILQARSRVTLPAPPIRSQLLILLLSFFWCYAAGLGEWAPQRGDFIKHNLIFSDLNQFSWPVQYNAPTSEKPFLCYYLAYYLPPSFLGKLAGIQAIPSLVFLWSWGGLYLIFNWILVIGERFRLGAVLGFVLYGGLKVFWILFMASQETATAQQFLRYTLSAHEAIYEINHIVLIYPVNIIQWLWCPHQSLGAWLVMGWLYVDLLVLRKYDSALFVLALSLFYSPFVFIGLLPILIAGTPSRLTLLASLPNILGTALVLFFIGGYFSAHYPLNQSGWHLPQTWQDTLIYTICLISEIGLPFLVIWLLQRRFNVLLPFQFKLFVILSASLALFSLWYMGIFNDFVMRASIPLAGLLAILIGIALQKSFQIRPFKKSHLFLFFLFAISAYVPLKEHFIWIARQIEQRYPVPGIQALSHKHTILSVNRFIPSNQHKYDFSIQYLGNSRHWFYSYFMKHNEPPTRVTPN